MVVVRGVYHYSAEGMGVSKGFELIEVIKQVSRRTVLLGDAAEVDAMVYGYPLARYPHHQG